MPKITPSLHSPSPCEPRCFQTSVEKLQHHHHGLSSLAVIASLGHGGPAADRVVQLLSAARRAPAWSAPVGPQDVLYITIFSLNNNIFTVLECLSLVFKKIFNNWLLLL